MALLPKPFSQEAFAIEGAISKGRALDAMDKLVASLKSGEAHQSVQALAAKWIVTLGLRPGDAKKLRGGLKVLPKEWGEIPIMVADLQGEGMTYDKAVDQTAKHFDYSMRHIEECVARWREAEEIAREIE